MSLLDAAAKSPLRSLGIVAPLAALIVFALNRAYPGLGLGPDTVAPLVELADVVLGFLLAILGRWRAKTRVRFRRARAQDKSVVTMKV